MRLEIIISSYATCGYSIIDCELVFKRDDLK